MAGRKFLTGIDLASQQIKNIADGSSDTDGVNLGQVKALANGRDWKESVRAASTANLTTTAPGASIDGVTLTNGDRVLLKNQSTGSQNGLWIFTGSASAMTRASDGNTGGLTTNATVRVEEGTVNAGKQYTLNTTGTITVGTTAQTWVDSSSAGGPTYTAGDGIDLTGNVVSVTGRTKKYATNVGDGTATSYTITHNLATTDVHVAVFLVSTGEEVECDITRPTSNTVLLVFAVAPTSNQYRCVVIG